MAISFTGGACSPIMLGNGATTQSVCVIENGIASRVNVIVRKLDFELDTLVALTAVMPLTKTSRCTGVSGGVSLAKAPFDASQTSDPAVVIRSAIFEGAPIVATPGTIMWQGFFGRAHTAVEQFHTFAKMEGHNALPQYLAKTKDIVLRPGESLLTQVVSAAGTSNAALTNNAHISAVWEEDEIATYAISGTVTLSGSPVSGAIVTVIEADDVSMTNAVLRETITTGAGGTWASDIRTGKVAAAFVQYENGGTYYTAPGSPYLQE